LHGGVASKRSNAMHGADEDQQVFVLKVRVISGQRKTTTKLIHTAYIFSLVFNVVGHERFRFRYRFSISGWS